MGNKRDWALDVMRGLAILLMVGIHSVIHVRPVDPLAYKIIRALGSLAGPFFLICSGVGAGYLRAGLHGSSGTLRQTLFRRGLFLIVFSSVFKLSHMDIAQILDWDIFTVIGVMYLLVALASRIRLKGMVSGLSVVLIFNAILPIGIPAILRDGSMPIIPFAAYFLFGLLFSELRDTLNSRPMSAATGCCAVAVGGALLYLQRGVLPNLTRFDFWTNPAVITIICLFLLLYLWLSAIQRGTWSPDKILIPEVRIGKLAFSVYYVQYFLLILLPTVAGYILHRDVLVQMPTALWLVGMSALIGFLYCVVLVWARFGFKLSLEWIIHRYVSSRSMFAE